LQGGTHNGGATAPVTTRDEYVFVGWDRSYTNVTANIMVNALWREIPIENLTVEFVQPNADYTEDTEVISTFRVYNGGGVNVRPRHNVSVALAVTYPGGRVSVPEKTSVVIPKANENLVYFKWRVPDGTAGKTFTLTSQVKVNGAAQDTNAVTRVIAAVQRSQTPATKFEREKPPGWFLESPPNWYTPKTASWSYWDYENDDYVRKNYATSIAGTQVAAEPDPNSPSRQKVGGVWTMRSGYGLSLKLAQDFSPLSGWETALSDAHTDVQNGYARFPEFNYSDQDGKFRALESAGAGVLEVVKNPEAKGQGRIHFTPLWFPDGEYNVTVLASDVWTPAGMLYGFFNANSVTISGSAYEDWYVAHL